MLDQLLHILSAFGLSTAAGLNASLPLLIVGLLARAGALTLAAPYDALASDYALVGLLLIAGLEFLADKVPGLDSLAHAVLFPLAVTAGAIVFAVGSGAVASVHPGAQIVVALLAGAATSGVLHAVRASARPALNLAGLGPIISTLEDGTSAVLAPPLVPLVLIAIAFLVVLVVLTAIRLAGRLLSLAREWLERFRQARSAQGVPDDGWL